MLDFVKRFFLFGVLLVLVPASSAHAVTLVNPDGTTAQPYQRWADDAGVPTVSRVVITPDSGGCVASCSMVAGSIWMQKNPFAGRRTLYHELGHHYDFQMPEWKRSVFRRLIGRVGPWYAASPHVEFSYSELFADLYATCAITETPRIRWFDAGPRGDIYLTRRKYRRVCNLIHQLN